MRSPSPWIDRHRSRHNAASLSVKQAVERIAQTCRFFSCGASSLLAVCLRDDASKGHSGRDPDLIEDVTEVAAHRMNRQEHTGGDLTVGESLRDESSDGHLRVGERSPAGLRAR
jgi:hypothetical protein